MPNYELNSEINCGAQENYENFHKQRMRMNLDFCLQAALSIKVRDSRVHVNHARGLLELIQTLE